MKTILTTILSFIVASIFCQTIDLEKRLEYLKLHDIYIVKVEFEHKKLKPLELDSVIKWENAINKNIRISVKTFWDLNKSIHFIDADSLKYFKKTYPHEVFLDFELDYFYGLNLNIPKKKRFFDNVSPRLFDGDTSLLSITEEIRQLKYNVIHGNHIYIGPVINKSILILDEPTLYNSHQKFIDDCKNRFPGSYQMVDRDILIKAIYNKDNRFIYIHRLNIINIEDGSLVPL